VDQSHDAPAWLGTGRGRTPAVSRRPPLSPNEGWPIRGRLVLRFRPSRWERQVQRLEITTGALLPDQEIPLLKSRRELSRAGRSAALVVIATIAQTDPPPARSLQG
jgi:hypothetical protein